MTALVIYFAYYQAVGLLVAMIRNGTVTDSTMLWFLHLLMLVAAGYLFRCRSNNRSLLGRLASLITVVLRLVKHCVKKDLK